MILLEVRVDKYQWWSDRTSVNYYDCRSVKLHGDGNSFLGMGAFGRVVRCVRTKDQKMLALKMAMANVEEVNRLEMEFSALFQAGKVCERVIKVEEIASSDQVGGMFFCGYTMELGEVVDFSSPKVQGECLEALMHIHVSGWCHGDARAANVVKVNMT